MTRDEFRKAVAEAIDSLPDEFRRHVDNVAVLVEDLPPGQTSPTSGQRQRILLGVFHGVPLTQRFHNSLIMAPSHIVLYQKNIEAICHNEAEVREQIRRTVIHEFGHYFGMTEDQLKDV